MNGIVVLEITFITFSLIKPEVGEWNRNFQFSEIFIIEFGNGWLWIMWHNRTCIYGVNIFENKWKDKR